MPMVSTATFGGRFAANFSPSIAVGIRTRIFDPVSSVFRFRMWTETSKAIRSSSTRNHPALFVIFQVTPEHAVAQQPCIHLRRTFREAPQGQQQQRRGGNQRQERPGKSQRDREVSDYFQEGFFHKVPLRRHKIRKNKKMFTFVALKTGDAVCRIIRSFHASMA